MIAKVGDLVAVVWLDTFHKDDLSEHEARELNPIQTTSYGRLLVINRNKVNLSGTEFTDGELREVSSIPRAIVIKVKKIGGIV